MFPERPLFDIVDEADGVKVHVFVPLPFDRGDFGNVGGVRGVGPGSFGGDLVAGGDGGAVLRAAEDVGNEGVVV